jgi:hypothetical protein
MAASKSSTILNIAIVLSTLVLVALIFYGNRFHKTTPPPKTTNLQAVAKKTAPSSRHSIKTYTETTVINRGAYHKAQALKSPLADAVHPTQTAPSNHPPATADTPDDPVALKRILAHQSSDLRTETLSQGMHPNDKRALTLTEKEIEDLEKSGSMIY